MKHWQWIQLCDACGIYQISNYQCPDNQYQHEVAQGYDVRIRRDICGRCGKDSRAWQGHIPVGYVTVLGDYL